MSKKIKSSGGLDIAVSGIRYEEFAKVKWQQFLRLFSLAVMLVIAGVLIGVLTGKITEDLPLGSAAVFLLLVLAVLGIYRNGIRSEYKRSGLSEAELCYYIDRDGWTVRQGSAKVTVPWTKTVKVRRNPNALLLYPNKKSVNILPLRCLKPGETEKIISWCTGKKS